MTGVFDLKPLGFGDGNHPPHSGDTQTPRDCALALTSSRGVLVAHHLPRTSRVQVSILGTLFIFAKYPNIDVNIHTMGDRLTQLQDAVDQVRD